ncbi:MAG TPA: EAL domain-containing protein [Leptolyngbyaceae cyanobacterium]
MPPTVAFGGRSILIASLVSTTLVAGLKTLGVSQPFELFSFDSLIRSHPDLELDSRVLIVGVSESDLQTYGWPLSDQVVAEALAIVQQQQPKAIGLDLYRDTPQPPGKGDLNQQLKAANVIAIMNVGADPDLEEVPPPQGVPQEQVGFNDLLIDPDGVSRRSLLFVNAPERPYYAFALRVVLKYLGEQEPFKYDQDALYLNNVSLKRLNRGDGGYQTIDNRGYQILTRYRSRTVPAPTLTLSQVLTGQFEPELMRDKVVLIGTTATSLKDEFYTPYSADQQGNFTQSGVVVHAQIVSQLLDIASREGAVYRFLPQWGEFLWLVSWAMLSAGLAWQIRRPLVLLGSGALLLGGVVVIGWGGLSALVWLPLGEPVLGCLLAGALVMMQKALYRSTHDWLTHLPGREVFLEQVRRALLTQVDEPVFVAFLDINRFKLINQSLGHAIGDRMLLTMADRLRRTLPEGTHIARLGGDEFALLFQHTSPSAVEDRLEQVQRALAEPFYLDQHRLTITASVGLAIAQREAHSSAADLLRDAHTAMYQAKALGEFSYAVFSQSMREEAMQRLQLESHLVDALEKKEFVLYYQPIVELETRHIVGFEALVRWRQQEKGFVSPAAFIPVAEETGLIIPLGQWIFQEACRQLQTWQQQLPQYPLKMSINLSRRQFNEANLANHIQASLAAAGLVGQQIQLEITESMIMRDVESSRNLMLRLKELGLDLAIDDFGTGYSSLSYLHRFPTDTLKVDQSFVGRMEHSPEDQEIVHTIVTLGHKLNLTLVAEGIETVEQMTLLRRMGCQYGQGYLFSRPVTGDAAIALLTQQVL